jgi:hypothetical protein
MKHRIDLTRWFRVAAVGLIVSLLAFPQAFAAAQSSTDSPDMSLYVNLDWSVSFTPLNPLTLEDIPGGTQLSWPGAEASAAVSQPDFFPEFAASTDGSTYIYLNPADYTVKIHDGWDGPLRHSISISSQQFIANLGQDGRYLTLEEGLGCDPSACGPRTLHTYDTFTGELVSTTSAADRNPGWPKMFAPDGTRLYEPVYDTTGDSLATQVDGPWPLSIVAYDLLSGLEIDRLAVPGIVGGSWPGDPVDGMYVGLYEEPAIALSPDGSTIAAIDPAMEKLVTIDAGNMSIEDTQSISQPTGLFSSLLTWLGVLPQGADAKVGEGRSLGAKWSADGQFLYVTGYETQLDETTAASSGSGLGITLIDAGSGDILDRALDGELVDGYALLATPDGMSLYATVNTAPWWEQNATEHTEYIVYRFDPASFDTLAERTFAQRPNLRLLAIDG